MAAYPPLLTKLANTPVLRSEMPAGFTRAAVVKLPAEQTYHLLGGVRIDFKNAHETDSESYGLFATPAQAQTFARVAANVRTGGLFSVAVMPVGRIVVAATAGTRAQVNALLQLALAHLRRSKV